MRLSRFPLPLITGLLIVSLVLARGQDTRGRFGDARMLLLPSDVALDQFSTPAISADGEFGFISSVNGALISFSIRSGKVLATLTCGQIAGLVSMAETVKQRLIAVTTANDPDHGHPATVSIINAANPERLERIRLVELPGDVHVTPTTRALMTADGRFGVVASSFNQPALFSFCVETGKISSTVRLPGWPSDIALCDGAKNNNECLVGVASVEANTLSIIKLDRLGHLVVGKKFRPDGMSFDVSNNPAFSSDGQIVYVAVHNGEHLFSIDTQTGGILGMIKLASPPQRITVAKDQTGSDLIGVTRAGYSPGKKAGGVTILTSDRGALRVKTEFLPPETIQLSRANNVVFTSDSSVVLVGSKNGTVFAFQTKSGEIESHKVVGKEIRGLALSEQGRALLGVSSTPKSDEIAIIGFDQADPSAPKAQVMSSVALAVRAPPEISKVSSDRPSQLRITIEGAHFGRGVKVEFVKAGDVVFRQSPNFVSERRLAVIVPIRKVEALGRFDLRVVAADKTSSNAVTIEPSGVLTGLYVEMTTRGTGTSTAVKPERSTAVERERSMAVRIEPSTAAKTRTSATTLKATTSPTVAVGTSPSGATTVVKSVRTVVVEGGLRVVVETNGLARTQDFTLSDPSRIVVDIVGAQNGFGNKTIKVDSGMIERIRVGQPRPGVVRVVLDTNGMPRYRVTPDGASVVIDVDFADPKVRTASNE